MSGRVYRKSAEEEKLLLSDDEYVQLDLRKSDNENPKKSKKNVLFKRYKSHDQNDSSEGPQDNSWFLDRLKAIPHVGYPLMVVAAFANATVGLLVKELDEVDPFIILVFRGLVIGAFTVPYLIYYGITPFPRGKMTPLLMRGFSFIIFMTTMFYGFRYLPLGDVRTISACQLIFVNLLACCFLAEACGAAEIQTVLVIMLGIVMVTNPPMLFGGGSEAGGIVYDKTYYFMVLVNLMGTFFQAVAFVACRYLRDIHPNILAAWGGLIGILPALLGSYLSGTLEFPPLRLMPMLFAVGFTSYMSQAIMIVVLQVEQAGTASVVRRALDILIAFALQVLWFGQVPGAVSILGSTLITVTVVFEGWRRKKKKEAEEEKKKREKEEEQNP